MNTLRTLQEGRELATNCWLGLFTVSCRFVMARDPRVYAYFEYFPDKDAAIVALFLFGVLSLAVLYRTVRSRYWVMLIASAVGFMELGGFAARIKLLSAPERGGLIAMHCLLIIPPSFFAWVDYFVLGRLVALLQDAKPGTQKRHLEPKLLSRVFFCLELGSLFCQGAGAGLSVNSDARGTVPHAQAGKALLIIGLAALVGIICFFMATVIYAHRSPHLQVPEVRATTRMVYLGLYGTTSCLIVRNIFRIIEFSQGFYGWIALHEVFFYIFDTLMMLGWLAVMVPLHFGVSLQRLHADLAALAEGQKKPGKGGRGKEVRLTAVGDSSLAQYSIA